MFPDGDNTYDLFAPGTFFLDAAVGDTINLTLSLQTEIDCTNTFEGGARTDFSSTGSYLFTGGFDQNFAPAMTFGDVDFLLRAREAHFGYKHIVLPFRHLQAGTKLEINPNHWDIRIQNAKYLAEKWPEMERSVERIIEVDRVKRELGKR